MLSRWCARSSGGHADGSAEEKVRIVVEGLRGEESVAELCRREGLAPNLYYRWSKEFLEADKKRLLGDMTREATAPEVRGLRDENLRSSRRWRRRSEGRRPDHE